MFTRSQLIKRHAGVSVSSATANTADLQTLFKFLTATRTSTAALATRYLMSTTTTAAITTAKAAARTTTLTATERTQATERVATNSNESKRIKAINFMYLASQLSGFDASGSGYACVGCKTSTTATTTKTTTRIQQRLQHLHTQQQQPPQQHHHHQYQHQPQQQQIHFTMSSLAAEPLQLVNNEEIILAQKGNDANNLGNSQTNGNQNTSGDSSSSRLNGAPDKKPCFNTALADILQFMELIGNLKHTKRTGWVLRDVNDCESISGHMYRMSILTFLLDGSEGLNQIRCMELALVHDLAESLVGDITPFCGISKEEKRNMEFKAMEDICRLIEPRGKRIMELFEEYESGQSDESRFVKDLDRLDMIMQAFEYEKRDNCLLKHQEFFDSTEGKFNHPFVKKLVNEIYEQRKSLAQAKGAIPPPPVHEPNIGAESTTNSTATSRPIDQTSKTS